MPKSTISDIQFLSGGGEMGQLMRQKDWSQNSLGTPDNWPQSLHTTLSILLNSKFPMFLFWGPELICFYNDAYRPSLGNDGKHPHILGGRGADHWKEIWKDIKPIIDNVLQNGEASWNEDMLLPIFRNGKMEDVYWTFSYSPVNDESGEPAGVFVTCCETTEKVSTFKQLTKDRKRLLDNITQLPIGITVLRGKDYIPEMANESYLKIINRKESEFINIPLFKSLPEVEESVHHLLDGVMDTGIPYYGNESAIPLMRSGELDIYYFDFLYHPLRDENNTISGIIVTVTEVTEKVLGRKKTEQNEEKLSIVIEASELGMWELNAKTREAIYSQRYLEILGGYTKPVKLSHEELLQHLHPDDMPVRDKAFREAIATGVLQFEARLIWKDKSIHWIEGKGKMFYDENKEPERLIGTIRDITKVKAQQQLLMDSERKFRLLSDSMPQHIWTADTEGNLNYFNKSVLEYTGLSLDGIFEKGWLEIVHPDDRDENVKKWMHSITTGEDFLFEHRFRRHDGVYRWQLSRAIPQRDENDKIQMWVGTSTDIEDQKMFASELEYKIAERTKELKLTNEHLKQSEERYHLMVEEVQDYAILYLNKEGFVENWNKGAEKIKGYKAEEIIGRSFENFYSDIDRKNKLPQYLLNKAAKHGRYGQEGWRVRKDGSLFWASVTITAVHNNKGELIGFSKVTHDLTSKKEADDKITQNTTELEIKNKELEKMNKELQSFAYISSHDLQEPLRKIQTFSNQIIETESKNLSESGKDKFERMQRAAHRMQNLINDLLAYSRTNTQDRKLIKTDLSEIIKDITDDLNEELLQKNATIEADDAECEVEIIPFQFHQLLFNLISNSLKFAHEDVPPVIKINYEIKKGKGLHNDKLNPNADYCHITFSDNGIGFEQQYSQRIFEVFQRLHGKEVYQGTGIGLAIVKKIVDNHNGLISASGKPNEGATFNIVFPVKGKSSHS
jgi:PAS domain S-box-containing protein